MCSISKQCGNVAHQSNAAEQIQCSKENNIYCVFATPLFLDIFPYSRNTTYLCIDAKYNTFVGQWNMFVVPDSYILMPPWSPPITIIGRQGCVALKMTLSQRRLNCKNGEDDEGIPCMDTTTSPWSDTKTFFIYGNMFFQQLP
jgi:hypothetical protein